jgi:hypothetical protein
VLSVGTGQLTGELAEINVYWKAGVFEGMVEVAAVDEDADAVHGTGP